MYHEATGKIFSCSVIRSVLDKKLPNRREEPITFDNSEDSDVMYIKLTKERRKQSGFNCKMRLATMSVATKNAQNKFGHHEEIFRR